MDELTQLRAMRSDIGEPSLDALSPAFRKLDRRMTRAATARARHRRVVAAIAAAAVAVVAVGQGTVAVQAAEVSGVLNAAADETINIVDPVVGPGQFLKVTTKGYGETTTDYEGLAEPLTYWATDTSESYTAYGASGPDVIVRTKGKPENFSSPAAKETAAGWTGEPEIIRDLGAPTTIYDYAAMPRGPRALLEYFDREYNGGSASRDENNWERMLDVLRRGDVPSDLRATLYRAIALLSNVTVGDRRANLDGREGIAIGRTEFLRAGYRQEIIIDPATGQLIGERHISTLSVFGYTAGEVLYSTSVTTQVVDSAP